MPRKKKGGNRGDSPEKSYPPFPGLDTHSIPTAATFPNYNVQSDNVMGSRTNASWVDVARQGMGENRSGTTLTDNDQTFFRLQEMFKEKLDPEVIHLVLVESQWKVNEALEKLFVLTKESECEKEDLETQRGVLYCNQSANSDPSLKSRLPSRISVESSSGQLAMLSPKTPSDIGPGYPDVFVSSSPIVHPGMQALDNYGSRVPFKPPTSYGGQQCYVSQAPMQTSVPVNKSVGPVVYGPFAGTPYPGSGHMNSNRANTPEQHPKYSNLNVSSSAINTTPYKFIANDSQSSSLAQTVLSASTSTSHRNEHLFPNLVQSNAATAKSKSIDSNDPPSKDSSKMGTTHNEQKNIAKKRGRKTTMSLNPEEREALENLIEDVIIGGIGEGVIDSEESASSSTESEEECKTQTEASSSDVPKDEDSSKSDGKSDSSEKKSKESGKTKQSKDAKKDGQKGLEQGQKVYPPQLKVAVKHMKNLPPRFLRKIQTNKDDKSDVDIDGKPKRVREKTIPEVVEPKETKPFKLEILPRRKEEPPLMTTKEKVKSKQEQMIEKKRRVRGMLLEGLDSYLEQSVDSDEKKQDDSTPTREQLSVTKTVHTETLSHSAPSSAQVSPNSNLILHQKTSSVDLNQGSPVDPAIKAQGPTISNQIRPLLQVPAPRVQQPRLGSVQSGGQIAMPRPPIYLQPNAVNCEELEREMFNKSSESHDTRFTMSQQRVAPPNSIASLHAGMQQISLAQLTNHAAMPPQQLHPQNAMHHARSQFSVDAPEFIPRAFTPGTMNKLGHLPDMIVAQNNPPPQMVAQSAVTPQNALQHPQNTPQQPQSTLPQSSQSALQQTQNQQNALQQQHQPAPPPHNALQQAPNALQQPQNALQQPPASVTVGRISPNMQNISTVATSTMLTQEQLVSVSGQHQIVGRNSPIPTVPGAPAYILPKVAPPNVHSGVMPPPPPGVSLMYAPMPATYPQFPGAYPATFNQLQHPFLVQAWSGGRKNHTQPLHPSHPTSRQKLISGMVHKGRSDSSGKGHLLSASKLPHRNQHEMTPQQAKEKVQNVIKQGKKVMAILRGLPGSGKSTIAKEIQLNGSVFSTDDFFMRGDVFEYNMAKLPDAHEWNQKRAREAVEKGVSPIVIDNTNTQAWEMRAYVALALRYDYHIEIIEPSTTWKFSVKQLAEKNVHSVSVETIEQMLERYEKTMSIEKIMGQVDKKKDESKQSAQGDDTETDKKMPRRKRRRRRRRKKKSSTEVNSDSEKAEDERSSDEEGLRGKQETLLLTTLSTDTTENEQEKLALDTTLASQSSVEPPRAPIVRSSKISSSSMDSEDLATILMNQVVFNQQLQEQDELFDPAEVKVRENKSQVTIEAVDMDQEGHSSVICDDNVEERQTEIGSTENCSFEGPGEVVDDDLANLPVKPSLVADKVEESLEQMNHENSAHVCDKTVAKETSNIAETSVEERTDLSGDKGLGHEVMNKSSAEVLEKSKDDSNRTVAEEISTLQTAVTTELEHYIREQIVEKWMNEELSKFTDGVINVRNNMKNGYTKGCNENVLKEGESSTKLDCGIKEQGECKGEDDVKIVGDDKLLGGEWEIVDIKEDIDGEAMMGESGRILEGQESPEYTGEISQSPKTVVDTDNIGQIVGKVAEITENVEEEKSISVGERTEVTVPSVTTGLVKDSPGDVNKAEEPNTVTFDSGVADIERNYWDERENNADRYVVGQQSDSQTQSNCGSVEADVDKTEKNVNNKVEETRDERMFVTEKPKEQRTPRRQVEENSVSSEVYNPWTSEPEMSVESVLEKLDPVKPLVGLASDIFVKRSVDRVSVETQTLPSDFSAIHKLLQGVNDPELSLQFQVKIGQIREFDPSLYGDLNLYNSGKESSPSHILKPMLDKGCMTEAEEIKEGIGFLMACFPEEPEDDLQDILDKCKGDTEWAINILLDSGCAYCDPATQREDGKEVVTATDVGVMELSSPDGQGLFLIDKSVESSEIVGTSRESGIDSQHMTEESSVVDQQEVISVSGDGRKDGLSGHSSDESEAGENAPPPLFLLCHKFINRDLDSTLMEQVSRQRLKRATFLQQLEKGHVGPPVFLIGQELGESCDTTEQASEGQGYCLSFDDVTADTAPDPIKQSTDREVLTSKNLYCGNENTGVSSHLYDQNEMTGALEAAESDLTEACSPSEKDLVLNLSPPLAAQLIQLFGPVGFHICPESLSCDDLEVTLTRSVGRQIHGLWARSLQQRFTAEEAAIEMMRRDEELARKLQAEEDLVYSAQVSSSQSTEVLTGDKSPVKRPGPPVVVGLGGGLTALPSPMRRRIQNSPSLKEIMEEERAIELSKREFEQQEYGELEHKLSTKLKCQKLHQLYPQIDPTALDEIFSANGYSLEASVRLIDSGLGQKQAVKTVMTAEEQARLEEQLLQKALKASQEDMEWLGIQASDEYDGNCVSGEFQSFDDPTYQDCRAEASLHYKLRHECFQKAQDAYKRGMKAVASFYSQQGHIHAEKLKEANKRAAEKIMDHRNKQVKDQFTIDLHGLHVDEALHVLQKKLDTQKLELSHRRDKRLQHLSVVTGQGKHSRGGVARIKPAVMEYLRSKQYRFQEMQPGVLRVDLKW